MEALRRTLLCNPACFLCLFFPVVLEFFLVRILSMEQTSLPEDKETVVSIYASVRKSRLLDVNSTWKFRRLNVSVAAFLFRSITKLKNKGQMQSLVTAKVDLHLAHLGSFTCF